MRIILAEELAGGSSANERSFEKETILVGRDAFECDISYGKDEYPMVSRRHAELRHQNGQWYVVDLNSSYGTFVNDQQITSATPISIGSSIRFGHSGPVLRVTWIEAVSPRSSIPSPRLPT
jgi:pSer/pThr/pTyr-binding forkhead associated (FHA) protein